MKRDSRPACCAIDYRHLPSSADGCPRPTHSKWGQAPFFGFDILSKERHHRLSCGNEKE